MCMASGLPQIPPVAEMDQNITVIEDEGNHVIQQWGYLILVVDMEFSSWLFWV